MIMNFEEKISQAFAKITPKNNSNNILIIVAMIIIAAFFSPNHTTYNGNNIFGVGNQIIINYPKQEYSSNKTAAQSPLKDVRVANSKDFAKG